MLVDGFMGIISMLNYTEFETVVKKYMSFKENEILAQAVILFEEQGVCATMVKRIMRHISVNLF